jgi:two-component system, response regulator RegA
MDLANESLSTRRVHCPRLRSSRERSHPERAREVRSLRGSHPEGGVHGRPLDQTSTDFTRASRPRTYGLIDRHGFGSGVYERRLVMNASICMHPQNSSSSIGKLSASSLLIVDDDRPFLQRLAQAMETRGFKVATAESVADGISLVMTGHTPDFAVVDMCLGDGNGLDVISALRRRHRGARAIVLTGYGNLPTAVKAVKAGAVDYLAKPVDAEDILAALLAPEGCKPEPPEHPMSVNRVRWEHINRIYQLCEFNVSETARQLNMHRRTLQRILARPAPV